MINTVKRLMTYIKNGYKGAFILVLFCIVLSAVANVAGSLFIGNVIDDYITPLLSQTTPNFSGLLSAIGGMACIYGVGIISTLVYNRLMVVISQGILKDIRNTQFAKMQTLPIRYFDTTAHGDIMSHYTNDTDTLRQMMSQSIPQLFNSAITLIAVFCAMLATNIPLTVLVLVVVFVLFCISRKIGSASAKYFIKQQEALGTLNGYIEEMIHGQKVIKVFCHEDAAISGFNTRNETLFHNANQANKFANILMPVMANFGNLQYVLVAVLGAMLMLSDKSTLTLGGLVAFLQLSKSFSMPINQISQQINAVVMAMAGAERIFKLMDEAPETDEGYVTLVNVTYDADGILSESTERTGQWAWRHPHQADGSVTYHPLTGDVRLHHVDFAYTLNKQILHDISLYAKPGQKLAFVGATGAGKTTITNLINRFYDIEDGKIRYDGININKICKPDLRRSLGIVLQDTALFTGSVMENIRYGKLDATDEDVIAAAKLSNADNFIRRLPEGYHTLIDGEGGCLSQGQCQLVAIARAAVADPPVMILDEATSSIDTRTEALVQQGMDRLMRGRTVFVIAHRLSTVRNSDAIMVMAHGHIIERGNHANLIAEQGEYYKLYTGAFELA